MSAFDWLRSILGERSKRYAKRISGDKEGTYYNRVYVRAKNASRPYTYYGYDKDDPKGTFGVELLMMKVKPRRGENLLHKMARMEGKARSVAKNRNGYLGDVSIMIDKKGRIDFGS
jgi:hypothetical protein